MESRARPRWELKGGSGQVKLSLFVGSVEAENRALAWWESCTVSVAFFSPCYNSVKYSGVLATSNNSLECGYSSLGNLLK